MFILNMKQNEGNLQKLILTKLHYT